jgi:hypothetical protein
MNHGVRVESPRVSPYLPAETLAWPCRRKKTRPREVQPFVREATASDDDHTPS